MTYFVTRMYDKGVISEEDTGGLVLRLGDFDAYLSLIDKVLTKQYIDAYLAEGWHVLTEKISADASTDFKVDCPIVKGVDTLTDARFWPSNFSPSMGLSGIVHSKGKHTHGATYWPAGPDIKQDTYFPDELMSLGDVKRDSKKMGITEEEMA